MSFNLNTPEVVVAGSEHLARPGIAIMVASPEDAPVVTGTGTSHAENKSATFSDQGVEAAKDIVYGSVAGIVGKMIEYPFDTVKVRLQAQPEHLPLRYTGPWDCFKQSVKQHGVLGLYRGVSAPLFGAAVETSSLFFSYRLAQDVLQSTVLKKTEDLPLSALVFCGAVSGAATSILLTPIELVKCKVQVPSIKANESLRPLSVTQVIYSVFRHQGIRGFWHGQTATLIRETGGSAAWFGSYEGAKLVFLKYNPRAQKIDDLPIWQRMVSGAIAGMSYNFLFYPADTIKSRMQTEDVSLGKNGSRGFWATARSMWSTHGLAGLYRGCGITVGRAAPSSAVIFTVYELLRQHVG